MNVENMNVENMGVENMGVENMGDEHNQLLRFGTPTILPSSGGCDLDGEGRNPEDLHIRAGTSAAQQSWMAFLGWHWAYVVGPAVAGLPS